MRNRTHRVAADLDQSPIVLPSAEAAIDQAAEIMVLIDGAHIRAAHGYCHLSRTVSEIRFCRGIFPSPMCLMLSHLGILWTW